MRVVIIGNGIIANLGALYLRKRLPESTEIVIVGPTSRGGLPVVGESTIEITAMFLEEKLGLGEYLSKNCYPKYALTYYFKLDPLDPEDRTYSVHCNERLPLGRTPLPHWKGPMAEPPSWQLNRATFDRDIQKMVSEQPNLERIEGVATDITIDGESGHRITIKEEKSAQRVLDANWVIDASGRKQFLARKLNLVSKTKPKSDLRDCFWFRLAGFDRNLLKNINALGPFPPQKGENYHYDRYYSTHHFMGQGFWIWMIPMKTEDNSELISIGISSHPNFCRRRVRSMDDFLNHVEQVHPVITDLVKSGEVLDTNLMLDYRYEIKQAFSKDRWCIAGDAAFTVDPHCSVTDYLLASSNWSK